MDLYDDIDTKPRAGQIDGWSSGIKMLQTQLAIKKAQGPKEAVKKPLMTPVVNLRAKKAAIADSEISNNITKTDHPVPSVTKTIITAKPLEPVIENVKTDDCWDFVDEYDPLWPNEYEKLKDKHQAKEKGRDGGSSGSGRDRKRGRNRSTARDSSPPTKFSGFSQRQMEEENYSPPHVGSVSSKGGAAIAPPPSLQEISLDSGDGSSNVTIPYSASSVAAKIMAKYGFKDGQGLGKQEQGMSMALQVEKTSKRGGRIIHEKDVFLPPPPASLSPPTSMASPTRAAAPVLPVPAPAQTTPAPAEVPGFEPTITEIMKQPSKVVLLRNMVGPGDVDEELEPEVKDECNTKYGDVTSVLIHESFGTIPEDAVKIFVEFKRIESAIKAVVDLNGRFFGGRQVRAGFYNFDKFKTFQLS